MKKFVIDYILYIYVTFIKNDYLNITKKWAISFVKSILFIHNIYIWVLSIILLPMFVVHMNFKIIENKLDKLDIKK